MGNLMRQCRNQLSGFLPCEPDPVLRMLVVSGDFIERFVDLRSLFSWKLVDNGKVLLQLLSLFRREVLEFVEKLVCFGLDLSTIFRRLFTSVSLASLFICRLRWLLRRLL